MAVQVVETLGSRPLEVDTAALDSTIASRMPDGQAVLPHCVINSYALQRAKLAAYEQW